MRLAIGQLFRSYEVVELIGVGGMGDVYQARDTRRSGSASAAITVVLNWSTLLGD